MASAGYVAVAVSLLLYAVMMISFQIGMARARRTRRSLPERRRRPRVSVLKPLAGADDALLENLQSFADLESCDYELLLGLASTADDAYPVALAFAARHPGRVRVVLTDPHAAVNPKVAQLFGLLAASAGEVVVVSDSNVRVRPDYLARLVDELDTPGTGLVSSVVAGTGERTLGAALENLMLATHVAPGVVAAYLVTGRALTIGKSLAMYRRDLEAIGGLDRVRGVLAEDYVLGRLFADAGYRVRVCLDPIENVNAGGSVRASFDRHTRWAKMRRIMSPVGFAIEPLTSPIPVATAVALASPSPASGLLLCAAVVVQVLGARMAVRAVRGHPLPWRLAPLELVRAFLMLAVYARAWASRRVVWRGHAFRLGRGTELTPVTGTTSARSARVRA